MKKIYTALGLMSGTSMDGVDASIIQTDGKSKYKAILDRYFKYPEKIYNDLTSLRDKIKTQKDLKKHKKKIEKFALIGPLKGPCVEPPVEPPASGTTRCV